MMPFAVGGLAAAMALYWGLAAVAVRLTGWRGLSLAIAFAVALAIAENLRGRLFTGFPWAAPGLAVDGMGPAAQAVSLVGMTGLTLLVTLWAGLPLTARERLPALLLLALLPLAALYGLWRLHDASRADVPGIRIRIVQPNISQDEKWREDNARTIFNQLQALSAEATPQTPDGIASLTHVLWPESAVPFFIDESPVAKDELSRLLGGKTVLITGADRREKTASPDPYDTPVFNSIITFDGDANVAARYDKWRLVPGGEFLPFEWLLKPLGFRQLVTTPGSFTAGPGPVTIAVPGAPPAAMLVCYEAAFPHDLVDAAHRPGWIVNVTNDGWFGHSTGPYQHLAQARLRAIEQGLPLMRAANTGISAVIDAYGRIRTSLAIGSEGVIDSALPQALPPTLYAQAGDGMLALLCVLGLGLAAWLARNPPPRKVAERMS
jgi:apolipoprotein N-acyltransferase